MRTKKRDLKMALRRAATLALAALAAAATSSTTPSVVLLAPTHQPAGAATETTLEGAERATTLEAAAAAARRLKATGRPVEVRLLPGTHVLSAPLRLGGEADSGVRWRGEAGAVVSGGAAVSGWSAGVGGAWSAPLPEGVAFSRILWVNGERRNRTIVHGADCCNVHPTSGIFDLGGKRRCSRDGSELRGQSSAVDPARPADS